MPGFPVLHCLAEFAQVHVHWIGVLSNHLILCHPLLLLPSIFPNIRVFSSESILLIMWPKYWSFHFTISPSNEYLGLISFRINWFDILAVRGTLKSLLQHHSSKASTLQHSAFFIVQLSHPYVATGKTIALTRWTFVGKVMSLLFNMLSRYVIAFLPRSKRLLISWLQSPSVILEPSKICHCFYFSPSICHEVMGLDAMILDFWMLSFKPGCRREDLGKDIQGTWVLVLVLWINVAFGSVPFQLKLLSVYKMGKSGRWPWRHLSLLLLLLLLSHFSPGRLCATPWTVAHQAPPSMGFSRQEYWSRVPLPSLPLFPNNLKFPLEWAQQH